MGTKRWAEREETSPAKSGVGAPTVASEEDMMAAAESDSEASHLSLAEVPDEEEIVEGSDEEAEVQGPVAPFRPGIDSMADDEELVMDESAYDMYHKFTSEWPCLTFDCVVPPETASVKLLGPQQVFIVAGTQAAAGEENALTIFRCENVRRTWEPASDEEAESDEEEDDEEGVKMQTSFIRSAAAFNKVVACPRLNSLVATMTDDAVVAVYDISTHLQRLLYPAKFADPALKPIAQFSEHQEEGFALDWCPTNVTFASGARDGKIVVYNPVAGGWSVGASATWKASVESLSFKLDEEHVFAAGACDGSVTIWDSRAMARPTSVFGKAHDGDVNVVKFGTHPENCHQLLSGGDDGAIKLIDLRFPESPLFENKGYHRGPICALDWNSTDYTTFVAGSYDDRCTVWDLSAEGGEVIEGVPTQLIFEHCGHQQLSAVKYHPTIPYLCVSTGADSFNIWRSEDLYQFAKASAA